MNQLPLFPDTKQERRKQRRAKRIIEGKKKFAAIKAMLNAKQRRDS